MTLDLDAYLARIGHNGPIDPTLACLQALHLEHVGAIPFENLDILLGRSIRLDLESLQEKMVIGRRGGYCFEHNTLFAAVLEAIGFKLTRLSARVRGGAGVSPRTHMVLRVNVEGAEWLVDVGFGGASILHPLPFEPGGATEQFGWKFRLIDIHNGRVLQALRPQGWVDYYELTFEPQHPVDYEVASHFTSTHPSSRFTKILTAQLSWSDHSLVLRNHELTEIRPLSQTVSRVEPRDLLDVLATRFTLEFPKGTQFAIGG